MLKHRSNVSFNETGIRLPDRIEIVNVVRKIIIFLRHAKYETICARVQYEKL